MRLTTKGRYAVTAMLDLAINDGQGPISLADISERHAISVSYLEQLFAKLRRAKLVDSVRGPGGGYTLGETHMDTDILRIVDAIDEKVDATRCQGRGDCHHGCKCITHELWEDLSGQIRNFLGNISLGELVKGHEERLAEEAKKEIDRANEKRPVTLV
ncbi:MAG: Rrf2 family transcriptional regulator [Gammaproteobacteria bacterium]|nr:Rrf2 family transcriptional regulator [Gammaproteobacteria bacterium]